MLRRDADATPLFNFLESERQKTQKDAEVLELQYIVFFCRNRAKDTIILSRDLACFFFNSNRVRENACVFSDFVILFRTLTLEKPEFFFRKTDGQTNSGLVSFPPLLLPPPPKIEDKGGQLKKLLPRDPQATLFYPSSILLTTIILCLLQ